MKMTPEQEAHLKRIKDVFVRKVDNKYRAGQDEHGGDLFMQSTIEVLDKAIGEAIDQIVYLETLRERLIGKTA